MDMSSDLIEEAQKYQKIILRYCSLVTWETRTDETDDALEKILDEACNDPLLSFLIDEADHIIGHELGNIEDSLIREQQGKLKKALDQQCIATQVSTALLKQAQNQLKDEGLYIGHVDGIYGPKTKQAFQSLTQEFQKELNKQGLGYELPDETCDLDNLEILQRAIQIMREEGKEVAAARAELLKLATWFLSSC